MRNFRILLEIDALPVLFVKVPVAKTLLCGVPSLGRTLVLTDPFI